MGAVLSTGLLKAHTGTSDLVLPESDPRVQLANSPTSMGNRFLTKLKGIQIGDKRHQWKDVDPAFLAQREHTFLGIQGFACTEKALEDMRKGLTTDTISYHSLDFFNIGFTKGVTGTLLDYADYLSQLAGRPLNLQGNSLGGFFVQLIAQSHPDLVNRKYFTASPLELTTSPADLIEHTNIAPFIGLMNLSLLKNKYERFMMDTWAELKRGEDTEGTRHLIDVYSRQEGVAFVATDDSTVNGFKCILPNIPGNRTFAVRGDHSDVAKGAIETILYLVDKPIDAELPPEINSGLVPLDEVNGLLRRTPSEVVLDFAASSLPDPIERLVRRASNGASRLIRRPQVEPVEPGPIGELVLARSAQPISA